VLSQTRHGTKFIAFGTNHNTQYKKKKKKRKKKRANIALNLLIKKLQIMESIPFWTFLSFTNWISCNKVSSFSRDGFNKISFTIPTFYGPKSIN